MEGWVGTDFDEVLWAVVCDVYVVCVCESVCVSALSRFMLPLHTSSIVCVQDRAVFGGRTDGAQSLDA